MVGPTSATTLLSFEQPVDAVRPGRREAGLARLLVGRIVEALGLLGLLERLLAEQRHLLLRHGPC
jgi:hypothetical protein